MREKTGGKKKKKKKKNFVKNILIISRYRPSKKKCQQSELERWGSQLVG